MSTRLPNTHSPVEVRQAIARLRLDADSTASEVDTAVSSISAVSARVTDLEETSPDSYSGEAAENIAAGMPVYGLSGLTSIGLARADTQSKSRVSGIAKVTIGTGYAVEYAADGKVELADWTAVAGAASLTPNAVYYLAETGGITAVAPATSGRSLVEVGRAVDSVTLDIEIARPILL